MSDEPKPLPEPRTLSRGDEDGAINLGYTAAQMRAYALENRRAQPSTPASNEQFLTAAGYVKRDAAPAKKVEANNDEVICPNCVHQFRAIPVNLQEELVRLRQGQDLTVSYMVGYAKGKQDAAPSVAPEPGPGSAAYVIQLLLAAGYVAEDKVAQAEAIARSVDCEAATPPRAPLTDAEIDKIRMDCVVSAIKRNQGVTGGPDVAHMEWPLDFARAVIAADRGAAQ